MNLFYYALRRMLKLMLGYNTWSLDPDLRHLYLHRGDGAPNFHELRFEDLKVT